MPSSALVIVKWIRPIKCCYFLSHNDSEYCCYKFLFIDGTTQISWMQMNKKPALLFCTEQLNREIGWICFKKTFLALAICQKIWFCFYLGTKFTTTNNRSENNSSAVKNLSKNQLLYCWIINIWTEHFILPLIDARIVWLYLITGSKLSILQRLVWFMYSCAMY